MKKILKRLSKQSKIISIISLTLTLLSILALLGYLLNNYKEIDIFNTSIEEQLLIASIPVFIIISVNTIVQNLLNIFYQEKTTVSGINVGDSEYRYDKLIDKKTKEIILVSQNFRGALNNTLKLKIKELILENKRVVLIGTTYDAMFEICRGEDYARKHYFESLNIIKEIHDEVDDSNLLKNLIVIFHPSASSLTSFFRDPFDKNRARRVLILGPKYSQDKNSKNRYYNVIEACEHEDLYQVFSDHLFVMSDPQRSATTLYDFCVNIIENHFEDLDSSKDKDLIEWFIKNREFSQKNYKIEN